MNTHKIVGMWTIMLILCLGIATATDYYYNSTTGNDANNCTTPALACKTISDLQSWVVPENSTVYFNGCEEPYRGAYNRNKLNTTYTTYGGCGNARMYGSINASATTYWTNISTNIWESQANFTYEVYQIYLNTSKYLILDGVTLGQRETTYAGLNAQWDFYWNSTSKVYVYSIGNPASLVDEIEIGKYNRTSANLAMWSFDTTGNTTLKGLDFAFTRYAGVNIYDADNIVIKDCNFMYGYEKSVYVSGGANNARIENSTFYLAGIRGQASPIGQGAQGENIYIDRGSGHIVVNNTVDRCGGVCINYVKTSGANTSYNVVKNGEQEDGDWSAGIYYDACNNSINTYNQIYDENVGLEVGTENAGFKSNNHTFQYNIVVGSKITDMLTDTNLGTGRNVTNIVIDHNTFIKTDNYTGSAYGRQIQFQNYENVTFTNNVVYNNYTNATYGYLLYAENGTSGTGLTSNYNSYFSDVGRFYYYFGSTAYTSLASWLTTGKDANSLGTNPELNLTSFKPVYDSIACTASSTGSYVGALPCESAPDPPIIITNPTLGQNVTGEINITWTYYGNTTGTYYNIYLLNNDTTINTTLAEKEIVTDATMYTTPNTCQYTPTKIVEYNIENIQVKNITYNHGVLEIPTSLKTTVYIIYADDTTYSTVQTYTGSGEEVTVTNPYYERPVKKIEIYQGMYTCSGAYTTYSVVLHTVSYSKELSQRNILMDVMDLNIAVGAYKINVTILNDSGYINSKVSESFNIRDNALLNLTVRSYSGTLLNFTANLSGEVKTGYGSVLYNATNPKNYTLKITATGVNTHNENFSISGYGITQKSVTLQANNSINLSIYNAQTLGLITQRMTIVVTSGAAVTYNTSTGNIILSNIQSGLNELKIYNENFTESRYALVILDGTSQSFNAYIAPINTSQNVTFTFYNYNGVVVDGLYVSEYVLTNESYKLVSSGYTDIGGKVYFTYNPTYSYLYNYTGEEYSSESFILNPPRESNYDITLSDSALETVYNALNVNGSASYNNATSIISFTYNSGDTTITAYTYTVSKIISGTQTIICMGTSNTTSNTFSCNIQGYTGTIYIQGLADDRIFYGKYLDIGGETKLSEVMDDKEAAFWSGIISLTVILSSVTFGIFGVLVGGVVGIIIVYWLGMLNAITLSFIAITIIASMVIALAIRRT